MEGMVYECQCGHVFTEAEIDLKAKKAVCKKCKSVVNLRENINRSSEVVGNGKAAVSAFLEKDYQRAKTAADYVLAVADDNIPALYISAYYNAFYAQNRKELMLQTFFNKELKEIEALPEEMDMLKQLVLHDPLRIAPYEQQLLAKMVETQDNKELEEFVESFSPGVIMRRNSIDWFTPEMIEIYCEIAKNANTSKTWFALYKQVGENPESPEYKNSQYNPRKAERFYNNYVMGVDKIYNSIADPEQNKKFTTAFAARKQKFKEKM